MPSVNTEAPASSPAGAGKRQSEYDKLLGRTSRELSRIKRIWDVVLRRYIRRFERSALTVRPNSAPSRTKSSKIVGLRTKSYKWRREWESNPRFSVLSLRTTNTTRQRSRPPVLGIRPQMRHKPAVPAQTPAPSQLNHSNFRSSLSLANSSYSSRQAIEADNSWSFLRQSLSVRQPDFKRSNLSYDGARCSTPSVKTQWMSDLSLGRILNLEEARTTRRSYAKLRDASRPHYSHSIISDDVPPLICKRKF
jgi:hypothetical protein